MAPNRANNTQSHGYMENECLILERDKKSYMNGHMKLIPRYQDAKQEKFDL
jgi:hypothetical protein